MKTSRSIIPTAAVAVLLLAGCSSTDTAAESEGGIALITEGTLTLCTNPPYEPFEFEKDGEVVGLDIDIVAEVAADLRLELATVSTPFEGIQSGAALSAGQCDIVASGITITDERALNLDFSDAYFDADQGLLVPAGSDLSSIESLKGKRISVMVATTGATMAQENGLTTTEYDDLGTQIQALQADQVDAVINDVASLLPYVDQGFEIASNFATGEVYGLGVKKGNTELLDSVNATLSRIRSDGTYSNIYAEWIGVTPSQG
ncbi:transporter substrate-binding domain-containing protein [Sanguibacter antarcticus]|uniref:Amino acid ABC transporter substrate-binding protein (PAAT family) n=1 Tax=Sanguibacter antarcticus TaxID=372484 RepID=A0A2A9E4X4_9MICO|nr:transporter substrate-binding domain-containing protein [Sanguibacter antarcticus]PFG33601.1 amino acid ABC transporter substrate-binding protein (PAAT family) [Sanguibacter antarcticus]